MVVHTDDLSYKRGYDIRQYNDISYCDYIFDCKPQRRNLKNIHFE